MYDGDLVRLRAIDADTDLPAYHRWFNDAEITRYLSIRYPRSRAAVRESLGGWSPVAFGAARFSVERLADGELIGFAALRDATPEDRDAELDLLVGERSAWGHGYGTDATRTLCRFGFAEMGLHRVHLHAYAEHAAAIRVYERAGFVHEGVVRDMFYRRGRWHDGVLMGLLADELR